MTDPARKPPDPRGIELLDRIRAAFIRKGFDAASMQDLAREAGVAVGSFYRYFPSKTAIVEALVQRDIARVEGLFDQIIAAPDPNSALRAAIRAFMLESDAEAGRLWAEVTAAALRQSEVAQTCRRMDETVCTRLLQVFSLISGKSLTECAEIWGAHAQYVLLLVKSGGMCNAAGPDPQLDALILRSIDNVLNEILPLAVRV